MFLNCCFGLSTFTRSSRQKQWTTQLQHCSVKICSEAKQVLSQTRMKLWGDWKGNRNINKVCLSCIFWAGLCEAWKHEQHVCRFNRPLSPHYQLISWGSFQAGGCVSLGGQSNAGQDMCWQSHSSSTLCLADTFYLTENNNTLSVSQQQDKAPVLYSSWIILGSCLQRVKVPTTTNTGQAHAVQWRPNTVGHTEAFDRFTQ